MRRILRHTLLLWSLLGLLVGCGQLSGGTAGETGSISGTITAPPGRDVAGTQVFACYEDARSCARLGTTEITVAAGSAPYQLSGLPVGNYSVYALKETPGEAYAGWYASPSDVGKRVLVTPLATGVDIKLRAFTGTPPVNLSRAIQELRAETP